MAGLLTGLVPTIILGLIIAAAAVLVIVKMIKDKISGKACFSCGGNCGGCSEAEKCGKQRWEAK